MASVSISIGGVDLGVEDEDAGFDVLLKKAERSVFRMIALVNDEIERREASMTDDEDSGG